MQLLDQADWLANGLQIGSAFLGILFFVWAWAKSKSVIGPISFERWVSDRRLKLNKAMIERIAHVAIVDDKLSDFPVSQLKAAGIRVATHKHVELGDLPELATYDLVFLDMHGIVRDDVSEGGLKLIVQLRKANPRQKICAVSSKTFDPTATAFFKQADDVQKKPISALRCQEVIEKLLFEKFDPSSLARLVDAQLADETRSTRRRLYREFMTAVDARSPLSNSAIEGILGKANASVHSVLGDLFRVAINARD